MRKLQQFYVYKFHSQRLKDYGYNIQITPDQARENGELISLGDSQVLRTIRKIRYTKNTNIKQYDKQVLENLQKEKKLIKKNSNSIDNQKRLIEIDKEIDEMLFVPEYVSVIIDNDKHYDYIMKNGFFIGTIKFTRLLCSAGNARVDTVVFCSTEIENELKTILKNGAKPIEITDNKYNAYFSLASSATHQVSEPNVLVVKDCEINMVKKVDWVTEYYDKDDDVEEVEKELSFNLFDGQGLITPQKAKEWADELELDYIPSAFCIRNIYIKGMVCTIDIHKFADDIAVDKHNKSYFVKDIWGNEIDIREVDIVLSQSQFKLWDAYSSWSDYCENCKGNDLHWGITRTTPKEDDTSILSNYQFIQVLNLDDRAIESLCKPTVEWINGVLGGSVEYMLLYLMGKICESDTEDNTIYQNIDDMITKAIILNNDMINDVYVKNNILYSLNKRIRQSYIGKLLLGGNFSVMISDPYAMLEHIFGLEVKGLLNEGEHYSEFWNNKEVNKVVAMRSPLTWRSEVNKLNLQKYNDWYKYINSGTIYNIWGSDCMIHADSDYDFDIVCTTDNKEFIDGCFGGLPITYKKKTVEKKLIEEDLLYLADKKSFHSKIGYVTNISTSYYALYDYYKDLYGENCDECKEIIKRLKICRKEQGSQIDKAKGILVKDFPKHWTQYQDINDNMSDEEIKKIQFENSLVISKRPYFFRYLYRDYNKKYNNYIEKYNKKSIRTFKCELNELLEKTDLYSQELDFIKNFKEKIPLINSNSVMNKVAKHMEKQVKLININHHANNSQDITNLLKNNYIPTEEDLKSIEVLYNKYNTHKDKVRKSEDEGFKTMVQLYKAIKKEAFLINSNIQNLATIGVIICYEKHKTKSKDFVWKIFGDGILNNIKNNTNKKSFVPLLCDEGDIEYMNKKYKMVEVNI